MFNWITSVPHLFLLTLTSFFILLTLRLCFAKTGVSILLYHLSLFFILFIAALGGGGVQNDGYARLNKFITLEENSQLEEAKNNLKNYDSMLQIDLQEFSDSNQFRNYLRENDKLVDKAEAISIGWIFTLLAEISLIFTKLLNRLLPKARLKKQM